MKFKLLFDYKLLFCEYLFSPFPFQTIVLFVSPYFIRYSTLSNSSILSLVDMQAREKSVNFNPWKNDSPKLVILTSFSDPEACVTKSKLNGFFCDGFSWKVCSGEPAWAGSPDHKQNFWTTSGNWHEFGIKEQRLFKYPQSEVPNLLVLIKTCETPESLFLSICIVKFCTELESCVPSWYCELMPHILVQWSLVNRIRITRPASLSGKLKYG